MAEQTIASRAIDQEPPVGAMELIAPVSIRARWSRKVAADIIGLGDMVIIIATLAIPCLLLTSLAESFPRRLEIIRSGLLACLVAYPCFMHWQLYDTRRMSDFPVRPDRIMLATAIAILAVIGISVPVGTPSTTMMVTWPLVWFCSASALLILYRITTRDILSSLARSNYFDERIAV